MVKKKAEYIAELKTLNVSLCGANPDKILIKDFDVALKAAKNKEPLSSPFHYLGNTSTNSTSSTSSTTATTVIIEADPSEPTEPEQVVPVEVKKTVIKKVIKKVVKKKEPVENNNICTTNITDNTASNTTAVIIENNDPVNVKPLVEEPSTIVESSISETDTKHETGEQPPITLITPIPENKTPESPSTIEISEQRIPTPIPIEPVIEPSTIIEPSVPIVEEKPVEVKITKPVIKKVATPSIENNSTNSTVSTSTTVQHVNYNRQFVVKGYELVEILSNLGFKSDNLLEDFSKHYTNIVMKNSSANGTGTTATNQINNDNSTTVPDITLENVKKMKLTDISYDQFVKAKVVIINNNNSSDMIGLLVKKCGLTKDVATYILLQYIPLSKFYKT